MGIYANAIRDMRVREYLPVTRVLWQKDTYNAAALCGNMNLQPLVSPDCPCVILKKGGSILLDFGIEFHGGIRIVNTAKTRRIRLRFGESASEAMGNPNQDHAIHDTKLDLPWMGMLEYGNTAFRFVRIDALSGTVELINVLGVALYTDIPCIGRFKSSDDRLNKIWETAIYTVRLNMQDYIYDGAKRDRLVWMGDLNPEIRAIMTAFQDLSLVEKSLDFIVAHSKELSRINGMPSYSFWWIITVYEYCMRSGNLTFAEKYKNEIIEMLQTFATFISPAGAEAIPEGRFLDWPSFENKVAMHAGLHGLLYWTLEYGAKLCSLLGIDSSIAFDARKRMSCYVPDCGDSKAAAAMLTISGLKDCSDVLLKKTFEGISTFFGFYMLQAQPTAAALELIRRYWGAMLDYGATTFWEDFDLRWLKNTSPISELPVPGKDDLHADFGNYCYKGFRHSLCHGWSSGPAPFMSERVLGITILEPGGKKILVKPDLGGLEYVCGELPIGQAVVKVEADASGRLEISAPSSIEVCNG